MAARKWTEHQSRAIETRDRTLLISAAAGSGKTATLTERVIRSILDERDPLAVTDLLVVTFTTAAAAELRERITSAIKQALSDRPGDAYLERQLQLLPLAKICTIDSFCNEILRENAAFVRVPPNYRIADGAEIALLATAVMENLIHGVESGRFPEVASAEEFIALSDNVVGVRKNEALGAALLYVYERTLSHEDGVRSLLPLVEEYDPAHYRSAASTRLGDYILSYTRSRMAYYAEQLSRALYPLVGSTDKFSVRYLALLSPVVDALRALAEIGEYGAMTDALASFPYPKMPGGSRADAPDAVESAIALYTEARDTVRTIFVSYFFYTEQEYATLYRNLYSHLSVLYRFLCEFDRLFREEKRTRALCEFSDIERYAYECLWQQGELTPYARSLAARFRAVYIDEYQDVNRLQDRIFEAVSQPDNRFMVGDIKQSIYSFRSASPEIFAEKKKDMPILSATDKAEPSAIFMSDNFRCDRGVVELVNSVFDCLFGLVGDRIGYVPEDALICSKYKGQESEPPLQRAELLLIESKYNKKSDLLEDVMEEHRCALEHEARAVASRIRELLATEKKNDGTPIRQCDVAILMRSVSGRAATFLNALREEGLNGVVAEAESFFLSPEILLTLALLNTLDNPTRDVYFSSLLLSPLYGFTASELYEIRESREGVPLYHALKVYCEEHPEFAKGASFLDTLKTYRTLAEGMPTDELLSRLYHETGLFTLASMRGGRDNLMLLYDYARRFESAGFRGLYAFISYINNLIAAGTTIDNKPEIRPDTDAVRILTIHSSKGLEYPVTFICNAGALIRDGDVMRERGSLQFSADFGLGLKLRDESGLVSVDNPVIRILGAHRMERIFDEELRILYVGLTRARERLFVSAAVGASIEEYRARIESLRERLSPELLRSLRSYMEWILVSTPKAVVREYPMQMPEASAEDGEDAVDEELCVPSELPDFPLTEDGERLTDCLAERMAFRYPDAALSELPEKLSVSYLHPRILDDVSTSAEFSSLDAPKKQRKVGIMPDFYTGKRRDEGAKRGTATHTVMQFCDFSRLKAEGVECEIERLVSQGYLTARDAELVHKDELSAFTKSHLIDDLIGAARLHRELRFHARLDAALFTEDEEKKRLFADRQVLVQGVIDCIIEQDDGSLILIDYKTDRLTATERKCPELAARTLRAAHQNQLSYYAEAIEQMFGRRPAKTLIYSLHLGESVEV